MKKICMNCEFFECCDGNGDFLEVGVCLIQDFPTHVADDDTCLSFSMNKQREEDLKNGM